MTDSAVGGFRIYLQTQLMAVISKQEKQQITEEIHEPVSTSRSFIARLRTDKSVSPPKDIRSTPEFIGQIYL